MAEIQNPPQRASSRSPSRSSFDDGGIKSDLRTDQRRGPDARDKVYRRLMSRRNCKFVERIRFLPLFHVSHSRTSALAQHVSGCQGQLHCRWVMESPIRFCPARVFTATFLDEAPLAQESVGTCMNVMPRKDIAAAKRRGRRPRRPPCTTRPFYPRVWDRNAKTCEGHRGLETISLIQHNARREASLVSSRYPWPKRLNTVCWTILMRRECADNDSAIHRPGRRRSGAVVTSDSSRRC